MIKVIGPDTGVLNRRMRHHAEAFRPLIDPIVYSLLFESRFAKDDKVHILKQSLTGPGSYGLLTAEGPEYHFRPAWSGNDLAINVFDAYRNGKVIQNLSTPDQCRMWIRRISK